MTKDERAIHDEARFACLESAEKLGLNMSCADEYECPCPEECGFYRIAAEEHARKATQVPT